MTTRYKHKSGIIVENGEKNKYWNIDDKDHKQGYYPKDIVEGSNDWEEIKEEPVVEKEERIFRELVFNLLCTIEEYTSVYGRVTEYLNTLVMESKEQPKEKPLLVTEDGVSIYDEEQLLWSLREHDWFKTEMFCKFPVKGKLDNPIRWKEFKWFSTEQARQDYIILNKPVLSLSDIQGVLSKCHIILHRSTQEAIDTLVKSKLKIE